MLLSLEPRGRQSRWMLLASPLLAGLLTLVCGALLFACLGHDPWQTLHTVLVQPLSDLYGLGELLVKAMPILLCALGLALAYQARVWNIGAEGQLLVGALAGSAVAIQLLDWQSRWALAWVLLAGTAAGALWAGFAAWLRTRFNANEILTTIMLNYIALNLLLYGVHGPLKDPDGFNFPQSALFGEASRLPALLAIHRDELRVEVLRGGERPLAEDDLSHPQAFVYGLGNGENGHGFFYPPRNARRRVDPRRPPPLLVWLHGGPTSMHSPAFDAGLQFWTQRGFAVAALNYRGSSGYGRAYRQRLRGQWGRLELRDIEAALAQLDAEGRIDRARVFVRGASAGGYSALRALACLDGLRGGASLYGVSDPLALARCTHKFEGDYLDWLIGDPLRQRRRYLVRSPVLQVGRIRAPVVFFQGGLDAVVVPEQTEAMVAGLRRSGVRVECHRYPQERHGFRQPANRAHALLAEWRFYLVLLED